MKKALWFFSMFQIAIAIGFACVCVWFVFFKMTERDPLLTVALFVIAGMVNVNAWWDFLKRKSEWQ